MTELPPFEVQPRIATSRSWMALGASALLHAAIILLLIFGIPVSNRQPLVLNPGSEVAQPLAITPTNPVFKPTPRQDHPPQRQTETPPPPPPRESELGPNSSKPDARAKEAAAHQSDADAMATPATRPAPPAPPPAPPPESPKPASQPPAPQRLRIPRPGDYSAIGALPMPTSSPFGPPKLDSASGAAAPAAEPSASSSMGRLGMANHDPQKWENSFDDETSGRCVEIPDLGKNPDGTPVLATVIGQVFDTDGRTPMPGAHLQILGTPFGTFSNGSGEYRLEFDPKLLAKCRVQYVSVVAPGYASQRLTLAIGAKVRSDPVVLHRH